MYASSLSLSNLYGPFAYPYKGTVLYICSCESQAPSKSELGYLMRNVVLLCLHYINNLCIIGLSAI